MSAKQEAHTVNGWEDVTKDELARRKKEEG